MTRRVAIHVGRFGEAAGGMTQVLNSYLNWKFDDFDVRAVASRDGSGGARAACLALRALWTVATARKKTGDLVVVHLSQGGSFVREGAALVLARWRGWPTIAQLHGSEFVAFAERRPRLTKSILTRADVVLSLSAPTSEMVKRVAPKATVLQVPNAVPSGAPRLKEPFVLFGGAVGYRKGVDVLLDAWQGIADKQGWRLKIAGPVRDPEVVRPVEGVEFLGALPHDELLTLLEGASVAVLPSRDEGMPMFLLEAMARGCCVVATEVGGVGDLVGEGLGRLVPPDDVAALQSALSEVMTSEEYRSALANNAQEAHLRNFSAQAVFPRVERIWMHAADTPRSA